MKKCMSKKLLLFVLPLFFIQCKQKNPSDIEVKAWCLQSDSAIYIRIQNTSNHSIFIPKRYLIEFIERADTISLECVEKKQFGTRTLYFYSQFSEPICTYSPIKGMRYDSIETYKSSGTDFQFQPPPMTELKPNGLEKDRILIRLHKTFRYATFRIY